MSPLWDEARRAPSTSSLRVTRRLKALVASSRLLLYFVASWLRSCWISLKRSLASPWRRLKGFSGFFRGCVPAGILMRRSLALPCHRWGVSVSGALL